jgi:GNAT superfamily N-acetyltransferase
MFSEAGPDYTIMPLGPHNFGDLEKLYRAVYHTAAPRNYYLKKYDSMAPGLEPAGFVTYYKELFPVAFCGLIPCMLAYKDLQVPAGQLADAMTHPEHRRKGLITELINALVSVRRSAGTRLFFVFPNQDSYPIMADRMKWNGVGHMQSFSLQINAIPFSLLLKIPVLHNIYKTFAISNLNKYKAPSQELPNSVLMDGCGGIYRDDKIIRYRSFTGALVVRLAAQSRAWIRAGRAMYIGDMEIAEGEFDRCIGELKTIARHLGIRQIIFQTSKGTSLYHLFASRWAPGETFCIMIKDFDSGIPPEVLKFNFADIDIF